MSILSSSMILQFTKYMNKAIFLDRDGTINVDKHYLYKIEEFEYIDGVTEALKRFQEAGFLLLILTNQSGIARGYYTETDFHHLNDWMVSDLQEKGINISRTYYCPHHPNGQIKKYSKNCNCRKPEIGMFLQAQKEFDIDMSKSFAIGDKLRDLSICRETEVRGILISSNKLSVIDTEYGQIVSCNSMQEACEHVINYKEKRL